MTIIPSSLLSCKCVFVSVLFFFISILCWNSIYWIYAEYFKRQPVFFFSYHILCIAMLLDFEFSDWPFYVYFFFHFALWLEFGVKIDLDGVKVLMRLMRVTTKERSLRHSWVVPPPPSSFIVFIYKSLIFVWSFAWDFGRKSASTCFM